MKFLKIVIKQIIQLQQTHFHNNTLIKINIANVLKKHLPQAGVIFSQQC